MIITPQNFNIFFTALETEFWRLYDLTPTWYPQIATTYPASTLQWLMGWIGMLQKLRLWTGPRVVHTPGPMTYQATIQPFELTYGLDEFQFEDDTHGVYSPILSHMGLQSKKWPDYQIRDLVEGAGYYSSASVQTSTDQVSHWSNAHPVDYYDASKGTYVNDYGTGTGTVINGQNVGGDFGVSAWGSLWSDMASRKNESGEKFGLHPDLTMVPTQLKFPATVITQNQTFAPAVLMSLGTGDVGTPGSPLVPNAPFVGAMDNPFRGSTDLFVNFDLTFVAAWYMLVTKWAVKPFGWALRKAAALTPRTSPTDPAVFDMHTFLWGVKGRGVGVWAPPFLSSRSGK